MPTIIDVARLAGVSPGTVSNALSGKRPVSDVTRERILKAINELGYEPNLMARSLVSQRSHIISIVVTEFQDLGFYGYSSTLTGIQQKANELGYSLMLHFVKDPGSDNVSATLNEINAYQVDGIIWAVHEIGNGRKWVTSVPLEKYPPIVHLHMHPAEDLTVFSIDNRAGASLATTHLVEQGCQTIGILTGPSDWWESQERVAGWRESLAQAGLDAADSLVVKGDWLSASGKQGMKILLERNPDLDAVFACNDTMALGALYTAHRLGIAVPDDLLIVGFDNTPEAASYWPPLTSIRQGLNRMGCMAIQELHEIIETKYNTGQNRKPTQKMFRPDLVVRRSSIRPGLE